jgi:glycosyltransferase involved in cell wall biosynthesis
MKILFVLEYYYPHVGGVETLFKTLIEALAKKGHHIRIITMRYDTNLPKKEKTGNIEINRIATKSRYIFTIKAIWSVFKASKKVDLIQTTSYNAAIPAYLGRIFSRKKVVITFHEVWGKLWFKLPFISKPSALLHAIFEQLLLKIPFTHFIAVSDFTKNKLIQSGIAVSNVSKIYNGIDYSLYPTRIKSSSPFKSSFHIVYFGRAGISKGLDILIHGCIAFLKTRIDCNLSLVLPKNKDIITSYLLKEIEHSGLNDRIKLTGRLSDEDLITFLGTADVIVIPSYSEGFCFAAVEAIALGIPVIASSNGALQEVISGSHLFLESFTHQGLKEALDKAINNEWLHLPIRKFELSETITEYEKLYQILVKL